MDIITTKQRFLERKERFIQEISIINQDENPEAIKESTSAIMNEIFGEDYKIQFPEQELHIFNALMKTIDPVSTVLDCYDIGIRTPANVSLSDTNAKSAIGAIAGTAIGVVVSSLLFSRVSFWVSGVSILGLSVLGYVLGRGVSNKIKGLPPKVQFSVDQLILSIDGLCEKIDDFMSTCMVQLERNRK